MRLCFDATRFGYGLKEAVGLASIKSVGAVEFTFEPFEAGGKESRTLSPDEKRFLKEVRELAAASAVEIACLNLGSTLSLTEKGSVKRFQAMVAKLSRVAAAVGCGRLSVAVEAGNDTADDTSGGVDAGVGSKWLAAAEKVLGDAVSVCAKQDVKLLLRLSTPEARRGRSLKWWRPLTPADWREVITAVPGLSLSLSPADCVWLGLDYLQLLPSFVPVVEHVEANDIEINQDMVKDSGLFGPLWWRYRLPGKGQLDWRQLIEALKLYGFEGALSIKLDDEFVGDQVLDLDRALDHAIACLGPLVKG